MNLLELFFPISCVECSKGNKYLCDECIDKVLDGTFDKNNFAIFKYKGVIKKALLSIKYKFATDISEELLKNCVKRLRSTKFHDITLVPIPLHKQRKNWRGFNQSELLGEKLAKEMNWKYKNDLLIRTKNTIPQVGLEGISRRSNLTNIFEVYSKNNLNKEDPILLFDDIYTTGSTISEARKELTKAGFTKIYSLTIAR